MKDRNALSRRQFVAMAFVSMLSPMIRLFPRLLARHAGRAAWLSPVLALPILALAWPLFRLLFRGEGESKGLGEVLTELLGDIAGRAVTLCYTLWLLVYAGFVLRSGALRLVSTIYVDAGPGVFIVCTALACGAAASGSLKALGRCAAVLRPLLALLPVLVFLLTVKDADFTLLLPVGPGDLPGALLGGAELANLFALPLFLSFAAGHIADGPLRPRDWLGWALALPGLAALITLGCLGMFGPELTAKMGHPFFMLTRDVTVLGALERVEPVAVAVWIFADFLLLSALGWIGAENAVFCLRPRRKGAEADRLRPWLPLCFFVGAAAVAFLLPEEEAVFRYLGDCVVPMVSAVLGFGVPAGLAVVGLWKRKKPRGKGAPEQ